MPVCVPNSAGQGKAAAKEEERATFCEQKVAKKLC
jgi:hypothetical protein